MNKSAFWIKAIVPFFMLLIMAGYLIFNRVPDYLSENLSKSMQTDVVISDASIGPKTLRFDQITIGSLRNSRLPKAFYCSSLKIKAWLFEYLKKEIVIDEVILDNVYLGLEFDNPQATTGNWTRLMANLASSTKGHQPGSTKTILIKKLIVKNISCQVIYTNKNDKPINLPIINEIVLENISSDGGFPAEQFMNTVLGQMLKEVFIKQNLKDMVNKFAEKAIDQAMKQFKWY